MACEASLSIVAAICLPTPGKERSTSVSRCSLASPLLSSGVASCSNRASSFLAIPARCCWSRRNRGKPPKSAQLIGVSVRKSFQGPRNAIAIGVPVPKLTPRPLLYGRARSSFTDILQSKLQKSFVQEHARFDQLAYQRASFIDQPTALASQGDSKRSNNRHVMNRGTTSRRAIIKNCPSRPERAMCNDLRLARSQIPMFDAGRNGDVGDAVSFGPRQCHCCRVVFLGRGGLLSKRRPES